MKKVWLLMTVLLAFAGCGEKTYQQKNVSYSSGYFYGIEPFRRHDGTSTLLYAVRDTATNSEVTVIDDRGGSSNNFKTIKEIYRKENANTWQQRPVLVHYQKVHRRWWAGTAADSTKSDISSLIEYQITGISYVPVGK